ncbi:hypothetical protein [Methanocella conradii]|uniref:hypothetical protein n=1 Tax=Methanocella conradii TaxID=1175444 RepID=UPI00157D8E4B|nr:hypothetical protein [Methanocella conradii]
MTKVLRDDSGQFLLLTGVIISIGMVILLIFLNQSSIAGHSSADSIMSFPKNDIRDIRNETIGEAYLIGERENKNTLHNTSMKMNMFNASFNQYASNVTRLFEEKGCSVNLTAVPALDNSTISNATIYIYYNNGETRYFENITVKIPQV